jgi:hypothetical protein
LLLTIDPGVLTADGEPPLPEGLGRETKNRTAEPSLPEGLFGAADSSEPSLPEGLAEETTTEGVERKPSGGKPPLDLTGFAEARFGTRTEEDPHEKDESIGETRLQMEWERYFSGASFRGTVDFLYDPVLDDPGVDLEEGEGWIDLRQAVFAYSPLDFMDVRIGRQPLTWGTGDLLFINDLFPKDWNSFFIGRDTEYLKAPSDAARVSVYTDVVNFEVIYTPRFDSDRFIDGRRISYWNGALGRRAGRDAVVRTEKPDDWFEDDEWAGRIFRIIGGYELALYGYNGYWKSPGGSDPSTGSAIFPDLSVYGASIRGNVAKGIGNVEIGYYDSEDDADGSDPFIRNGEFRFLVGYEQEIARNLTGAVQYYLEHMLDDGDYRQNLFPGVPESDENRQVWTLRLTKLLMNQNLNCSLFTYYSPSDHDAYLRPNVRYKVDDHWSFELGGNFFMGNDHYTFFGQFYQNSNVYTAVRYGF